MYINQLKSKINSDEKKSKESIVQIDGKHLNNKVPNQKSFELITSVIDTT